MPPTGAQSAQLSSGTILMTDYSPSAHGLTGIRIGFGNVTLIEKTSSECPDFEGRVIRLYFRDGTSQLTVCPSVYDWSDNHTRDDMGWKDIIGYQLTECNEFDKTLSY